VNLGLALSNLGRTDEAIEHFRTAIGMRPDQARAHNGLASCLLKQGQAATAIASYREAVRLDPKWPLPAQRLAWIYATHPDAALRDGAAAVSLAEQSLQLSSRPAPEIFDTLAAAYAEAGRHEEAVRAARQALDLCSSSGRTVLAEEIRRRMALYGAGRAFRE
jgi:Flp pilus assembly protein TadD